MDKIIDAPLDGENRVKFMKLVKDSYELVGRNKSLDGMVIGELKRKKAEKIKEREIVTSGSG